MRGDDDDGQLRMKGAQALQHHEPADIRKADIEDRKGEGAGGGFLDSASARGAKDGGVAHAAGDGGECGGEGVFVFDDEDHGMFVF